MSGNFKRFENKWGDTIELYEEYIQVNIQGWGWFPPSDKPVIGPNTTSAGEYKIPYTGTNLKYKKGGNGKGFGKWESGLLTIIKDLELTHIHHEWDAEGWEEIPILIYKKGALAAEKNLDYHEAIRFYELALMNDEARHIRERMKEGEKVKVDQTVVHGDYVDDRDTIVKDSVINRSNVGAGGKSKAEEIKEIKELLDSGAIDDDEFKQMKKEILGK